MIRQISIKDKSNFCDYLNQNGNTLFSDCSFKNLQREFNSFIKFNKFCIIDEENDKIRGILFIEKIDDKNFIKTSYNSPKILDRLLQILFWSFKKDLILKINDYKIVSTIKKYYFRFNGKENDNFVYVRKYFTRKK